MIVLKVMGSEEHQGQAVNKSQRVCIGVSILYAQFTYFFVLYVTIVDHFGDNFLKIPN